MQTKDLQKLGITKASSVLLIYPHPDDETFANAGLIQELSEAGVKFKVMVLTKGEASTLYFGRYKGVLSDVREKEFDSVMQFLGVPSYEILGYKDKHLENELNLGDFLTQEVREFKATHIVTYEPCGIYGHPDHVYLSELLTSISKYTQTSLDYSTVPRSYKIPQAGLAMAKNPKLIKPLTPTVILPLSVKQYFKKLKAITLYESQYSNKSSLISGIEHLVLFTKEYYHCSVLTKEL